VTRPIRATTPVAAAATLLFGALAAGCGGAAPPSASPAELGTFPIAYPPSGLAATPVALPDRLTLLVMGDTARAEFPDGSVADIRASGPDFAYQGGGTPGASSSGTMTVLIHLDQGQLDVRASQFTALDAAGRLVSLQVRPQAVSLHAGDRATLTISGVFIPGDSNLTWAPPGHIVITWDFSTELD